MELRVWAYQILTSESLKDKLYSPEKLTDNNPGPQIIIKEPARSPSMQFQKRLHKEKLPSLQEHSDPQKRAICLHRFAGHELLAVEIMAYAILAFPEAPRSFRMGIAHTLKEEQEHVNLYLKRMLKMNLQLGDLPLYKHFWSHVKYFTDPIKYLSAMSLTFEMANLDFAPYYKQSFARYNDTLSCNVLDQIIQDEIRHVSFGYRWLHKMKKKEQLGFDTWKENLSPLLTPKRAKGFIFQTELRKKANICEEWIEKIKAY